MKNNKGFASITIVLIIIAVLAVGGIAYFVGKSSNPLPQNVVDNNLPPENQNNVTTPPVQNTQVVNTNLPGPVFKTNSATNISSNSATLNATILGLMDIYNGVGQSSYFEYGISSTNLNLTSSSSGPIQGTLSTTINGLQPNTIYYFRVVVKFSPNSIPANAHQYGNIMSFTTINSKLVTSNCLPTTAPWIKVLSPAGGEIYTVGQQVAVKWTSCNVQNVWLGLMSGGKDFGEITYPNPVPASQGSYQWTVSNPGRAFTQSDINSYQIGVESQSPNVLVKSEIFSVKQ